MRTVSGSAANLFALSAQIVVQLLSVPILSSVFGIERYGIWLILSTIPFYLLLSDLGLTTAAMNDMAMKAAADKWDEVLGVFQSVSLLVIFVVALVVALISAGVFVTQNIAGFWPREISPYTGVIPLLTVYAGLCLISLLPVSALKATGHYVRATISYDLSTFVEGLAMLATAFWTNDLVATAAAPIIIRAASTILMYRDMRRRRPGLYLGLSHASGAEIRRLLPSALGFLAIPIGLALSLQGTVIVIGAILGPAAVAVFVPTRTASRLMVQGIGIVNRAIVPELAAARGRGDRLAESRYWRLSHRIRAFVLLPAALGFAVFGSEAVKLWSGGLIDPPSALVVLMGVSIVLHGSWFFGFMLLCASHEHTHLAKIVLAASALGLAVATILTSLWGLAGAAASMVLADLILAIFVERSIRRRSAERTLAANEEAAGDDPQNLISAGF